MGAYTRKDDVVGRALLGHGVRVLVPALPLTLFKQLKAGTFLFIYECSVPNTAQHTVGPCEYLLSERTRKHILCHFTPDVLGISFQIFENKDIIMPTRLLHGVVVTIK